MFDLAYLFLHIIVLFDIIYIYIYIYIFIYLFIVNKCFRSKI